MHVPVVLYLSAFASFLVSINADSCSDYSTVPTKGKSKECLHYHGGSNTNKHPVYPLFSSDAAEAICMKTALGIPYSKLANHGDKMNCMMFTDTE